MPSQRQLTQLRLYAFARLLQRHDHYSNYSNANYSSYSNANYSNANYSSYSNAKLITPKPRFLRRTTLVPSVSPYDFAKLSHQLNLRLYPPIHTLQTPSHYSNTTPITSKTSFSAQNHPSSLCEPLTLQLYFHNQPPPSRFLPSSNIFLPSPPPPSPPPYLLLFFIIPLLLSSCL